MPPIGTAGGAPGAPQGAPLECPPLSPALIAYLERTFPDRAPSETDSVRDIRIHSGKVAVVRHLRSIYERQQRNILNADGM